MQRAARAIELTAREAELLEMLLRNPRTVVLAQTAVEQIWGGAAVENVVDRYVARLRRKLGDPLLIRTVWGVGFILERVRRRASTFAPHPCRDRCRAALRC